MQVGIRPSGGLRLWDIQFNGQRIVYELALQEAMMSAAGTTPSQVTCHPDLPCPALCCPAHVLQGIALGVSDSMLMATAHCKLLSCTCNLLGTKGLLIGMLGTHSEWVGVPGAEHDAEL